MIAYVALALLSLSAYASAASPATLVEGLSVGLTVDIGNVTECTKDIEISLDYFHQSLAGIKTGFEKQDQVLLESSLVVFGKGLREVSHAFTVCGLFNVAERTEIAGQQVSEGNVFTVTPEDVQLNGQSLTDDFKSAAKYWAADDTFQSGVFAGRILSSFLESSQGEAKIVARQTYFA